MSSYTSFAVVGYGEVGSLFADEILKLKNAGGEEKYEIRVLTRSTAKPGLQALISKGVDVRAVDYASRQSIANALSGIDVVLSGLRDGGLDIQTDVIRAAKDANVKLFVPSEYGRNSIGDPSEYLKVKVDTHNLLKELHLPYTLFFTGIWPEMLLPGGIGGILGIDLVAGKFNVFGDGTLPLSYTSPRTFVPFAVHVLTTLAPSQLENHFFELEADRKSFQELIALWEAKHPGRRAQVTLRSEAETQQYIDVQTDELFRFLARAINDGKILLDGEAYRKWPAWEPLTWEDLMP